MGGGGNLQETREERRKCRSIVRYCWGRTTKILVGETWGKRGGDHIMWYQQKSRDSFSHLRIKIGRRRRRRKIGNEKKLKKFKFKFKNKKKEIEPL